MPTQKAVRPTTSEGSRMSFDAGVQGLLQSLANILCASHVAEAKPADALSGTQLGSALVTRQATSYGRLKGRRSVPYIAQGKLCSNTDICVTQMCSSALLRIKTPCFIPLAAFFSRQISGRHQVHDSHGRPR